ncbi:MAG: cytochrome C biogenesis protein, partial [Flavobacteriaceae bacterium]|nr:cytochrome C biogenesis protein [Flavobacteriaceae bacterium]
MKKFISSLFNTRAAGLYFVLFAAAIGTATFIENDFGTSAAQKVIFKAWWFELLLILFGITILVNIQKYRMIQQKKWAVFLFHVAIIIIIIGAGVTRYFGFEGVMHIRENTASNSFLSADTYLNFDVISEGNTYSFSEPVLFASLGSNDFEESYQIGQHLVKVEVKDFLPNPEKQVISESIDGQPILKIVVAGTSGREEYYLEEGKTLRTPNLLFNFTEQPLSGAINISYQDDVLNIQAPRDLTRMVMATQEKDTLFANGAFQPLELRSLYS